MEQKSTRLPLIRLGCILLAFVHAANGAVYCFMRHSKSDNRCYSMSHSNPSSSVDCCTSYPNGYYAVSNISIPHLVLFGAFDCSSCAGTTVPAPTDPPCNKTCPRGKKCKVKPNGKVRCVCPDGCCTHHPHRTSHYPLCATDGCTYRNECEYRQARRGGKSDIEVAYRGVCQTGCANVVCRKNRTCMVDQYNRAFCVDCNYRCSFHSKQGGQICGADGVTYNNRCHLRKETCKRGKAIGVAYTGPCIANSSCDKVDCKEKLCVEDHAGRPRCVTCVCNEPKPSQCPGRSNPTTICGTDNKSYKDFCSMRREICKIKKFIDAKHLGYCKGDKQSPPPPKDEGPKPTPSSSSLLESFKSEDVSKYYISLRNFVDILSNNYPLNITSPKYKNLKMRDKVVLVSELLKQMKTKWRKIKNLP